MGRGLILRLVGIPLPVHPYPVPARLPSWRWSLTTRHVTRWRRLPVGYAAGAPRNRGDACNVVCLRVADTAKKPLTITPPIQRW